MLHYIKQDTYGSALIFENYEQKAEKASISIVKLLCEKALFSYDSREHATKENSLKYIQRFPYILISIYFLIPTKSPRQYDNVWLNYFAIVEYHAYQSQVIVLLQE